MPLIDINKVKNRKKPICPYCEETIDRFGSTLKTGRRGYEILFCLECASLLAVVPEGKDIYDAESTIDIISKKS